MELRLTHTEGPDDPILSLTLEEEGRAGVTCNQCSDPSVQVEIAWKEVVEMSLDLAAQEDTSGALSGLVLRIGRAGMMEHVFHTAGLASLGWGDE
jgi:hypothetical protein